MPRIRVVVLSLLMVAGPARAQRPDRAAFAARVDSIVTATMADERIPGASIAVVRGADTIMRGFGYADVENRVAATPATVYRIGSVTKQFTALAVLQLAAQGRLSLDDTVQRFVPSFPTPDRHITIRHLLNHTPAFRTTRRSAGRGARGSGWICRTTACSRWCASVRPTSRPAPDGTTATPAITCWA